jgi:hypothetical protein
MGITVWRVLLELAAWYSERKVEDFRAKMIKIFLCITAALCRLSK